MNFWLSKTDQVGVFFPIKPPLRSPKKLKGITSTQPPKIVQKAALKPTMSQASCGETPDCSDTDRAMTAMIARPTEFPNWPISLKTPPASDWRSDGNASEITRFDIVNNAARTCQRIARDSVSNGEYELSGLMGDRTRAQNGAYQ